MARSHASLVADRSASVTTRKYVTLSAAAQGGEGPESPK